MSLLPHFHVISSAYKQLDPSGHHRKELRCYNYNFLPVTVLVFLGFPFFKIDFRCALQGLQVLPKTFLGKILLKMKNKQYILAYLVFLRFVYKHVRPSKSVTYIEDNFAHRYYSLSLCSHLSGNVPGCK